MKLQRFFVFDTIGEKRKVSFGDSGLIHQITHVFRLKSGDNVILLDNSGFEYLAKIDDFNKKEIFFFIEGFEKAKNNSSREVFLCASMIKKDNFEWVLEKCTELGVSAFIPIISERSEKKGLNMERAQKIIKEASEQSERGLLPKIVKPAFLEDVVKNLKTEAIALDFSEKKLVEFSGKESPLAVFVGPEGGWGENDKKIFEKYSVPLVSLGSQVLRAETASVAVCSKILLN